MKKKPDLDKYLEEAKRLKLPKTINLHAMKVREYSWDSDPEYITFNDMPTPQIIRTHNVTRWVLEDTANNWTVTIETREIKPGPKL